MKFCTYCGKEIMDEAVICVHCGCPVAARTTRVTQEVVLHTLANRLTINGILWICIGVCQCLIGYFLYWWVGIVGIVNIISAIADLRYSKTVYYADVRSKIVQKFEPLAGPILVLIYNTLIGGLIGVIGSIYYFIAIRGYVMENRDSL